MGQQQTPTKDTLAQGSGKMVVSRKVAEEQYQAWRVILSRNTAIDKRYILWPIDFSYQPDSTLCGNNGKLTIIYDDYQVVLTEQIARRLQMRLFYTSQEIWFVLFCLLKAIRQLQLRKVAIGSLCSQNVVLNNLGSIKLISSLTSPGQTIAPLKAPQQTDQHLRGSNGQAFRLGLIILQMATLYPSSNLYDKQLNLAKLQQRQRNLQERYKQQKFVTIVMQMLAFSPAERLSCKDLYGLLLSYQGEIMAMSLQFQMRECFISDLQKTISKSSAQRVPKGVFKTQITQY